MKNFSIVSKGLLLVCIVWTMAACEDEKVGSTYQIFDDNPASGHLAADERFDEWVNVLRCADMYNALNQATQAFTVFAPDNDAVRDFYARRGVASIDDLGPEYARALVMHHTVLDSIKVEDMQLRAELTNLAGDKIAISIDSVHAGQFVLDDEVHVYEAGIHAYNALLYYVDGVLTPLVETLYDRLSADPAYSIITRAVEATGWAEALDAVYDTLVLADGDRQVNRIARSFLAVSDATFAQAGITSYEGLVSRLDASGDCTLPTNNLYEYIAYHTLDDCTVADLCTMAGSDTTRIWGTAAENQVMTVTVDTLRGGCFVNLLDDHVPLTRFVVPSSDILCKNGHLHEVDSWLPVWEPTQSTVAWDLANYVEVRNAVTAAAGADQYHPAEPVSAEKKVDISKCGAYDYEVSEAGVGGNSYAYVTYVNCKKNLKEALHYDRVAFNLGYMGSVSMKTPTLVRGKYRVELSLIYLSDHNFMRQMTDGNGGLIRMSFDDNPALECNAAPYTTVPKSAAGVYTTTLYDEVEFPVTAGHTFRFVVMDPAASTNKGFSLQFDCITFIPID